MSSPVARSDGFTLIEILVGVALFSVLSVGFYSVLLAGVRGSETTQSIADISEEARLGLNRMVRDTRQATEITAASADGTAYTIRVDFNRDGDTDDAGERERFSYAAGEILLEGEVLVTGVSPIGGEPVFDFSTNLLEYDLNGDGVATWEEVDEVEDGDANDLDAPELEVLSNVQFTVRVSDEDRATNFRAEAQLRNRR